ncbi:MAG TPA: hypothetical protein VFM18_17020 [Methanosarcina sp.]|nr:hypothetical protein [Methanosarcina sp.]
MFTITVGLQEFRNTYTWGSQDGQKRVVKDLDNSHLVNILNWIKAHPKQYRSGLYELFEEEAMYRRLEAFASDAEIPTKLDNGRWVTMQNGVATNSKKDQTYNGGDK